MSAPFLNAVEPSANHGTPAIPSSMYSSIEEIARLRGLEEATPDVVAAVLEEAARLSGEVLAPINQEGDRQGSQLIDGVVRTPGPWRAAYKTFVEGGWNGAVNEPEYGGMGLPWLVNAAVQEMIHGANMSFALCPMLTQSAIEAIALNAPSSSRRASCGKWSRASGPGR